MDWKVHLLPLLHLSILHTPISSYQVKIGVNVLTWNHPIIGGTIVYFRQLLLEQIFDTDNSSSFDNTLLATMIDCIIRTVLFGIISCSIVL